jgi:serine/threonine protein kinase
VVGTYGYMPYEQYMGQASPASDLYALGATFLHLVTGRPPSDFMTDEGRLAVPPSLPVDEPMRGVIARLLEASPSKRFASAREAREALLASPARPARGAGTALAAAGGVSLAALEPAPRKIDGVARERYRRLAPSMWQLMEPTQSPDDAWGVVDVLAVVFFSTITAGVLPLLFLGFSQARKRRLRRFFREGTPAVARIIDFRSEDLAFGAKLTRVRYEFEADGRTRRGSDTALPYIADRWREGEQVEILYIPKRGYDSVIVSAE